MKTTTLIAAIILIFAATFAFEYYANSQFKDEQLVIGTPEIETGVFYRYRYIKAEDVVGSYTYSVVDEGDGYLLTSETQVSNEADQIQLNAEYSFSSTLEPENYHLIALTNDDRTDILSEVSGDEIITYVTYEGVTVNITDAYVDGVLFIEPNMPGFWEVLFNSVTLEGGVKYEGDIYVPQGASVVPINLVVNRESQDIRVNGTMLSCTVIKEAGLDLAFYLYEGELVQMRSDGLGLVFEKVM